MSGPDSPPRIVSMSPGSDEERVSVTADIVVLFSEKIDPETVSESTLRVSPEVKGDYYVDGKRLILRCSRILYHSTRYTVTVTTGIKDIEGDYVSRDFSWSFVTRRQPPVIYRLVPDSGRALDEIVIEGSRFDLNARGNSVSFGGRPAEVLAAQTDRLTVRVAVGSRSGPVTVSTSGGQSTSPAAFYVIKAGRVWTERESGTDASILSVVRSDEYFMAVGDNGTLLWSFDGFEWEAQDLGVASRLEKIIWTGARYVVIGSGGTVLTSTSGFNWAVQETNMKSNLLDIDYTPGKFVAVGADGTILISSDAQDWVVSRSSTRQWLYGITTFSAGFIAVGYQGTIITSNRTASYWVAVSQSSRQHLLDVEVAGELLFAVGYGGTILRSEEGHVWQAQSSGTSHHLGAVAWGNDEVIAVGEKGCVLYSSDYSTWETAQVRSREDLHDLVWSGALWVAVGDNGTILVSY